PPDCGRRIGGSRAGLRPKVRAGRSGGSNRDAKDVQEPRSAKPSGLQNAHLPRDQNVFRCTPENVRLKSEATGRERGHDPFDFSQDSFMVPLWGRAKKREI